jgi:hypothetical protein
MMPARLGEPEAPQKSAGAASAAVCPNPRSRSRSPVWADQTRAKLALPAKVENKIHETMLSCDGAGTRHLSPRFYG